MSVSTRVQFHRMVAVIAATVSTLPIGCGGPRAVELPELDPQAAGAAAVAGADQDGDGLLSVDELKKYPALGSVRGEYDADHDDKLSAQEVADGLLVWRKHGAGLKSVRCVVYWNRAPLVGATVTLEPEEFLGPGILPASGTSQDEGLVPLSIPVDELPDDLKSFRGIHLGMYKVRVTHPSVKIPSKFNAETVLGQVVGVATREIILNLSN
ncbi:MAG: hypothetical protein R3E01_03000 [Pirellulaceae bacterium]